MHTLVLGDFLWAARRRTNQNDDYGDDYDYDDDDDDGGDEDHSEDDDEGYSQVTRATNTHPLYTYSTHNSLSLHPLSSADTLSTPPPPQPSPPPPPSPLPINPAFP